MSSDGYGKAPRPEPFLASRRGAVFGCALVRLRLVLQRRDVAYNLQAHVRAR